MRVQGMRSGRQCALAGAAGGRVTAGRRARCVHAKFEASGKPTLNPIDIESVTLPSGLVDYYQLLDVPQTAKQCEIKTAYRQLQKLCHPDILGPEKGSDMSILLNQAYTVLADENTRELYNIDLEESRLEEKYGFTGQAFSEWLPATQPELARNWNGAERRALFVDERTCIGCKSCVWQASNTFVMEEEHGRARVTKQWADVEDSLQNAVDCCPVDCIHWVDKEELPVLEHVMKEMDRINTGTMRSYLPNTLNVFEMARTFHAKKIEGKKARQHWTEAYMYSKAQEDAMERARGSAVASSMPGFAAFRRIISWFRGFQGGVSNREAHTWSPHKCGPVAEIASAAKVGDQTQSKQSSALGQEDVQADHRD